MLRIFAAALMLALAGCSYKATPAAVTSFPVYSTFKDKVPGTYALIVDSTAMQREVKVQGYSCSFHSYPVDMREAFKSSVLRTLQNAIENVELAETGNAETFASEGIDGVITVRVDDYSVQLNFIPGFWSAQLSADANITAGLIVEKGGERVAARSFGASRDRTADAGMACDGGAQAVSGATTEAVSFLLQQIAEEIASTPELHAAAKQ